jgi:hypothetical protein
MVFKERFFFNLPSITLDSFPSNIIEDGIKGVKSTYRK